MSVRKRQWRDRKGRVRTKWMVHIEHTHPDGTRETIRRISPVQSKRGAERFERELRLGLLAASGYERKETSNPVEEAPRFAAFAEEFLANYAAVNNKLSELLSKRSIFRNHLIPFFGRMRLDKIGPREIERYKASKLKTHSKKSINNHLTVLRKTLTTAADWGLLEQVPRIQWLKAPKPSFRFLDFEEADRLLAGAAEEPSWQVMILSALRTGLRLGELRALRWEDLDLGRGQVRVVRAVTRGQIGTPKNGKPRDLPLAGSLVAALEAHKKRVGDRGPWVFTAEDGSMLSKGQCKWPLRRAQRRAELAELGWHDLRHTFASHLVMRGVPVKVVQELLGHQSIEVTMRYAHLAPSTLRAAIEVLEARPPHSTWTAHGRAESENGQLGGPS